MMAKRYNGDSKPQEVWRQGAERLVVLVRGDGQAVYRLDVVSASGWAQYIKRAETGRELVEWLEQSGEDSAALLAAAAALPDDPWSAWKDV